MHRYARQMLGASVHIDVQQMTTGTSGVIPDRQRGFISGGVLGALVDGTSNIYGGANILELYHDETLNQIHFKVAGLRANSGWASFTANGTTLTRASGAYSQTGGNTQWIWTNGNIFGSNPQVVFD